MTIRTGVLSLVLMGYIVSLRTGLQSSVLSYQQRSECTVGFFPLQAIGIYSAKGFIFVTVAPVGLGSFVVRPFFAPLLFTTNSLLQFSVTSHNGEFIIPCVHFVVIMLVL